MLILIKKLKNYRKGLTFVELIIATGALAILMLGFSQFTGDIFNVSAKHAEQLSTVSEERFSAERVITEISKAAYVYPANIAINLSNGITINTTSSVAMLLPDEEQYMFVAYYIDSNKNLTEYISDTSFDWAKDACPATNFLTFSGSTSIIAKNINTDSTVLQYVLNYENAPYDKTLKGEVSGYTATNPKVLIKGVNWKIAQGSSGEEVIQIKGISKNVPRYIED